MKNYGKSAMSRIFCLAGIFSTLALGQQIGFYQSYSWDQPSGNFYGYSQATADYSTGYYYSVCTEMILWQTPGSYSISDQSCDATDAEVNWYTTVSTSPVSVELESANLVEMDYYDSQFEDPCGDYCSYYWDAYEANFIDGGQYGEPGQYWYLPGPPGVPYPDNLWTYTYADDATCTCSGVNPGDQPITAPVCPNTTSYGLVNSDGLFAASYTCNLSSSSSCNTPGTSGDVTATLTSCNIQAGVSATQHVYYSGPAHSGGGGTVTPGFSLVLIPKTGSNVVSTCNSRITISCP